MAALLLLVATVVVTKPYSTVEQATRPGVLVPNAMLAVVSRVAPDGSAGQSAGEPTQRRLLTRYWKSFVAHPLSRMQTGTGVLADAPPAGKANVLESLRKNVSAVNDWAVGRRGPERAFIATSALGYVVPFAVGLGALAMIAACAQTLLFLLCLGGVFALPLAFAGRRHRRALVRFLLAPLVGSVAVLAAASLLSFVLVRAAETLHASDEYVGLLLAGSTWPALAAFLLGRWLTRRRQGGPLPPVRPPPRTARGADRHERRVHRLPRVPTRRRRRPRRRGRRAAAWLLAWPMRLAATPMGRRLLVAATLAVVAVVSVGWLYDSADPATAARTFRPAGMAAAGRPASPPAARARRRRCGPRRLPARPRWPPPGGRPARRSPPTRSSRSSSGGSAPPRSRCWWWRRRAGHGCPATT